MSNPGMVNGFVTIKNHIVNESKWMLKMPYIHYIDVEVMNSFSRTSLY
jgi:hypothetical protein